MKKKNNSKKQYSKNEEKGVVGFNNYLFTIFFIIVLIIFLISFILVIRVVFEDTQFTNYVNSTQEVMEDIERVQKDIEKRDNKSYIINNLNIDVFRSESIYRFNNLDYEKSLISSNSSSFLTFKLPKEVKDTKDGDLYYETENINEVNRGDKILLEDDVYIIIDKNINQESIEILSIDVLNDYLENDYLEGGRETADLNMIKNIDFKDIKGVLIYEAN